MSTMESKNGENLNDIDVEEILAKIETYFGFVPKIFQVLSENPRALNAYFKKLECFMEDDSLPPLTKEFISIGAASALGAEHCLKTHVDVARESGATDEQILLAIMMGAFITETKALASSLRVYEEFKGCAN